MGSAMASRAASFSCSEHTPRVEIRRVESPPSLEFRLHFLGRVHREDGIVHDKASLRRERHRAVDRSETFGVQPIVVVGPSPALTVVAVGDIELDRASRTAGSARSNAMRASTN